MRRALRSLWLWTLVAGAGCGGPDVVRHVMLMPEPELPSGRSLLVGPSVRVTADGLEPLAATSRYVAWAGTASGAVALGELQPGEELAAVPGPAAPLEELLRIFVSEENAGTTLPAAPSQRVRMQGSPGAALDYLPVPTESLAAAHCVALIADDDLHADAHGLPPLDPGLRYALWATVPGSMKDNPDMGGMGGEADPAAEKPMVFVGNLDVEGALETSFPSLATATLLAITVESDRGTPKMSPARCLHGEVQLPAAQEPMTVHSH